MDSIILFGGIFIMLAVVSFMVKEGISDEFPLVHIGVILLIGFIIKSCLEQL